MAGYIGAKASVVTSGAERKQTYAITTTTTSLTGLAYTPTKVHVYHNGIRLVDGTDYTATNGTSIALTTAAEDGDEVVVISYATFQTSDTVSAANGGTFAGNLNTVDIRPTTDDNNDLGTSSKRFQDLYLSGGLYLGGTGSANYLDDYEVGTWTPAINVGSIGSVTYAQYVKVGNHVTITSDLSDISNNTSTSDVNISGLPFNTSSGGRFTGTMMFRYINAPSNKIQLTPYIGNNSSTLGFYWSSSTASSWDGLRFADANQANWDIYFTLTYRTDA